MERELILFTCQSLSNVVLVVEEALVGKAKEASVLSGYDRERCL